MNVSGKEPEESEERARGWESLSEWTGGAPPESIDALRGARELEPVYPLLHGLVGRSPRDFLVRAAALEALITDGRPAFTARDLEEILYWLDAPAREATMKSLRANGWMEYDPGAGTTITDAGRWAYEILGFLHKRVRESELLPTVAGIEYALQIGVDPIRHLESLRSRLRALHQDILTARSSHSEVALKAAAGKLDEALALSKTIRAVLDRVPRDHRSGRRSVRDIHDLLSILHGAGADLHAAVAEVGRQYLHLTAGMTVLQIARALMQRSRDDLAAVARAALLPVFSPPPLLNTEVVAASAEQQAGRERRIKEPVAWAEPPEPSQAGEGVLVPEEVTALLADLGEVARAETPVSLEAIVPRNTPGESFLRATLLPLAGDARAGEGVAGQLGALPLTIETEDEGWPRSITSGPVQAITPGTVRRRDASR